MYARFMLDAHTISATIAGSILGILCAALCTSNFQKNKNQKKLLRNYLIFHFKKILIDVLERTAFM